LSIRSIASQFKSKQLQAFVQGYVARVLLQPPQGTSTTTVDHRAAMAEQDAMI
jgi:hypothetical protein